MRVDTQEFSQAENRGAQIMTHKDQADPAGIFCLERKITSSAQAVSETLCALRSELDENGHPAANSHTWEIVLAEALNNVVEHAYKEKLGDPIVIRLEFDERAMKARVVDWGVAMPNLQLPEGNAPEIGEALEDHPEGGFGWHLIKELTDQLEYTREKKANTLTFLVTLD